MRLSLLAAVLLLSACGGFEGTVTQKVDLKQGDIAGTTIAKEKDFDSEGAAWNTFVKAAKEELGGDAETITVTSVKLTFEAADSKNVGKFEEAIKGVVTVYAKEKDTNITIDLGTIENPVGNGTVELDALGVDLIGKGAKFGSGQFKIGVKGDSVKVAGDDFELRTTVTLGLEAK